MVAFKVQFRSWVRRNFLPRPSRETATSDEELVISDLLGHTWLEATEDPEPHREDDRGGHHDGQPPFG